MEIKYGHFAPLVLSFLSLVLLRCKGDDTFVPEPTGRSKVFKVINTDLSNITGTASFIENEDESTTIKLNLENMDSGRDHPVYIRTNVAATGGGISIDLGTINANKGESSTTIYGFLSGEPISYEELIAFNGYLGIEQSVDNPGLLLAYTDIGPNELTGANIAYGFGPVNGSGVSGSVKFSERVNGTTLVEMGLDKVRPNSVYPVTIKPSQGGSNDILITLSSLRGEKNNTAQTQVASDDNGDSITFDDIIALDAIIEVHPEPMIFDQAIARGGIGSNENANKLNSNL